MNCIVCSSATRLRSALLVIALAVPIALVGSIEGSLESQARANPGPSANPELVAVEAVGIAPVGGRARNHALDRAFSSAVEKVVTKLIGPQLFSQSRAMVRARILRRARRYVASFRVLSTDSREGRLHVRILARVRQGMVRTTLRKLGLDGTRAAKSKPGDISAVAPPPGAMRPAAAVILQARRPGRTVATFGSATGAGGPVGKEFARRLDDLGFSRVSLAGKPVPTSTVTSTSTSTRSFAAVPVSDAAGIELAKSAGAGVAVIVGATTTPQGRIRGTRLVGADARVHVRVLDVATGRLVSRGDLQVGGFAATAGMAQQNAGREAARRAVQAIAGSMRKRWPAPPNVNAAAVIAVQGVVGWSSVTALLRGLRSTPGVARAGVQRLGRRSVLLEVDAKLSPAQIVTALRAVSLPIGAAAVSGPQGKFIRLRLTNQTPVTP